MTLRMLSITVILLLLACGDRADSKRSDLNTDYARKLQEQLILADSGAVITIPAGHFTFSRSLSLDAVDGVTIKGAGMNETILDFDGQTDGAEGLHLSADHLTLEGFTVQDTKGDAIRIQDAHGLVIRDVKTTWTHGAKESNGGYGLYPVACTSVLIEYCEASYASDAGIYIGQSTDVIMRHNLAHHNVAGIEIENSRNVEAHDNIAEQNTGGILIFDMPGLPQANGYRVSVHDNISRDNNHKNFAPEGGVVATLPPGTGMLVIAHKDVEIFNNQVTGYKTLGLGVISWFFTERPFETDNGFDPYFENIYVHNNIFSRKKAIPDLSKEFGKMINGLFIGKPQDIVVDGIFKDGVSSLCLQENGDNLRFANLNAENASSLGDLKKLLDRNMSAFDCELDPLGVKMDEDVL